MPPFNLEGFDRISLKDVVNYEKSLNTCFFNEKDEIYFKDLELDEDTFAPKISEWKKGTIVQVINVKQVRVAVEYLDSTDQAIYNTAIFNALYLKSTSDVQPNAIELNKKE